ncbi:E3 ubiquitin-protein ligase TRIM39-like [Centropristis striata]|uniref:E3 ubiquitin-protein ligase TRIM39-like n=1 Tax=Centropristis striata TaxID=184440 RepID=UPI0027DEB852|nr:E3 ubiquitin-protein ligase TRIM39-like [Centropristis striata]
MSSAACLLSEDHFLCSICLDVFTSPVTIPCGHNFCKNCITENWRINRKGQCPMCKKFFDKMPELHVNTFISEMASQFRQSALKKALEEAGLGEVPCDVCIGVRLKASKSCLVCLASYCETHLERHQTVAGLKRHTLIDPLDNLEDRVCTKHNKLMELFCKTDQVCACQFCAESEHATHDVVLLEEESEGKKTELGKTEEEFQQLIQQRHLKIQELRHAANLSKGAADKETADGVQVLAALTQFVETGLSELIEQINKKQKNTAKQVGDFIGELEQEISELMRRKAELKQLSGSKDHLHLIQSFSSLNASRPTKDLTNISVPLPSYEGTVARAVASLKETLDNRIEKLLEAELKRVQRFAVDVVLDPDTAHPKLILSDDGKQVSHSDEAKDLPDNPERFSFCVIVLGKQSFSSGKFYYEVEVKDKTKWDIGVISSSASRKGELTSSPECGYWTLQLRNGNEYVALADPDVLLSLRSQPQKVGVFVDYEDGLVSFYDVEAADIIYSFTGCSFTDKLHPSFSPCFNDGGDNSAPLRIAAVHNTD